MKSSSGPSRERVQEVREPTSNHPRNDIIHESEATADESGTARSVCARINQVPYNPRNAQNLATELFGSNEFTRATVPGRSMPNVRLAGQCKERVIVVNPETRETLVQRVVFDQRGFPIFDPYVKVETRISGDLAHMTGEAHMRAATRQLKADIEAGKVNGNIFTKVQLDLIDKGVRKIPGFTWHHHQETGRMQLVPEDIHEWIKHIGGNSLWGVE